MHEGDVENAAIAFGWVPARGDARVGELGTVRDCAPGDLVVAQSPDGARYAWARIAFYAGGLNAERGYFAYVWGPRNAGRQRVELLRHLQPTMKIRWLGLRSSR